MAHQHPVKDTDLHFVIDPVTRVIKNNSEKIVIMQHDHQSEILTFELPRYIDTHDMSLSNAVRVHYINIGTSTKYTPVSGVYEVNDLQVDAANENLVTCSWTLTNNTTQLEGTLNFIIRFSCLTGDTIDYSWSTAIYSGIIVAKTIDSSDYVMTAIPDILEQWKASLKGDPFTYEDFTPEQLEGLRGPAGVIVSETEPTNEDHPVWIRPSGEYIVENLGISGASVGQTVKIKAVDSSGVPTEWEAADMASGGSGDEWEMIADITTDGNTNVFTFTGLSYREIIVDFWFSGTFSTTSAYTTFSVNGVGCRVARMIRTNSSPAFRFRVELFDGVMFEHEIYGSMGGATYVESAWTICEGSEKINTFVIGAKLNYAFDAGSRIKIRGRK